MSKPLLFALRALGLGDFLVGVPAYRALRRAFPEHEIRLATTAGVAPLAATADCIDSISPAQGPDDFAIPAGRVDVAVNLHGRGPQSTRALRALPVSRLICFRGPGNDDLADAPQWDEKWARHERERWCHLLHEFGIAADPADFRLVPPRGEPLMRDAVVVHAGAAFGARCWPLERFAAVARALTRAGHRVVMTGSRAEVPLAVELATQADLPASAILAGKTDIVALTTLVAHARLVICGDTGPAHLATAYGTPSVVLFGPTPPHRWGPPHDPRHVALWSSTGETDDDTGDPCAHIADPRLLAIGATQVIQAALQLLNQGPERLFLNDRLRLQNAVG